MLNGTLEAVMTRTTIGMAVGGGLGLLDGLSAWMYPEARTMMLPIVVGSTLKGVVTGLISGFVASRRQSLALGITVGLVVGFGLSALAARGQASHYWEIVLPGMLVGAITGFVTQRYPRVLQAGESRVLSLLLVLSVLPVLVSASHQSPPADALSVLDFLIGRWEGTSEGQPGKGTVERQYARALRNTFIEGRNRSVYPPQEKNPKGETHEDFGMFSFDKARKRIVFRQFHVEGFVTHYVQQESVTPGVLVFETEAIENIPSGWRARETYRLLPSGELEEVFELAEAGKSFEIYSRTRLRRSGSANRLFEPRARSLTISKYPPMARRR
jgi:hypothetical protein